jgi:hypothetical protein
MGISRSQQPVQPLVFGKLGTLPLSKGGGLNCHISACLRCTPEALWCCIMPTCGCQAPQKYEPWLPSNVQQTNRVLLKCLCLIVRRST